MGVKPVKTAVIGCGMISDAYFRNMVSRFEIMDLVACCNRTREKAEAAAEKYGIQAMDIEEIAADPSIELVVNLTPAPEHYAVIRKMLLAGKHVYTEKVFTLNLEEAKELVELANEKGLYLGCAPDTFLGASLQTAKYVVESGMIGDVTSCYAALNRELDYFAEFFSIVTKPGGGIGFDAGIYYITALLSILGPVTQVAGISKTRVTDRVHEIAGRFGEPYTLPGEDICAGTLEFANGAVGNLLFDFNATSVFPERPAVVIYGTMGIVYLNDPNQFGGEVKVLLKGNSEPFVMQQCHGYEDNARGVGAAEMAWALRQGRKHRADKEMAYHALEILHGIGISGREKRFYEMQSSFETPLALPRGYKGTAAMEETAIAK